MTVFTIPISAWKIQPYVQIFQARDRTDRILEFHSGQMSTSNLESQIIIPPPPPH